MNLATLRVEGDEESLSSLIAALILDIDIRWARGDPIPLGGTHSTSGFCATISDVPTSGVLLAEIRNFLGKYERYVEVNDDVGLTAELAIGVTVGDSDQYTGTVVLGASDMLRLGNANLTLSFSAYPTSDEVNND